MCYCSVIFIVISVIEVDVPKDTIDNVIVELVEKLAALHETVVASLQRIPSLRVRFETLHKR